MLAFMLMNFCVSECVCSAAVFNHWQVIKKMRSLPRTHRCVSVILDDTPAAPWTLASPREHFTSHFSRSKWKSEMFSLEKKNTSIVFINYLAILVTLDPEFFNNIQFQMFILNGLSILFITGLPKTLYFHRTSCNDTFYESRVCLFWLK